MVGHFRSPVSDTVDVLVIGAGLAGATVARRVVDLVPSARVLLIEAGPQLGPHLGVNVRNLERHARAEAEARCKAADKSPRLRALPGGTDIKEIAARPGTHLLHGRPLGSPEEAVHAAAYSANVGGMAAHWTCAIPRPAGSECVPFIPAGVLDRAFRTAESILRGTQAAYPETDIGMRARHQVERWFEPLLGAGRPVQPMPLACLPSSSSRQPRWSGVDTVIGDLPSEKGADARIAVRPDAICRRIRVHGGRVEGADFEDVHTGAAFRVRSGSVVVACGAFHTPQLLWASNVRAPALGRYLNVHSQTVATVSLDGPVLGVEPAGLPEGDDRQHLAGVYWVPFNDDFHPFSGQVMVSHPPAGTPGPAFAGLAWYGPKTLDSASRVTFSTSRLDRRGMPEPAIYHSQSDEDRTSAARALDLVGQLAPRLGQYLPGCHPRLLVSGKSLHYQSTTRMGAIDDGCSVCDPSGRVWGFDNLYVAGTGVLPTATACNPTLTAVALATLTADSIVGAMTWEP